MYKGRDVTVVTPVMPVRLFCSYAPIQKVTGGVATGMTALVTWCQWTVSKKVASCILLEHSGDLCFLFAVCASVSKAEVYCRVNLWAHIPSTGLVNLPNFSRLIFLSLPL